MNISYYYGSFEIDLEGKGGMLYDYKIKDCITVKTLNKGCNEYTTIKVISGSVREHLFPIFGRHERTIDISGRELTLPSHYLSDKYCKCIIFSEGQNGLPKFTGWDNWNFEAYFEDGKISRVVRQYDLEKINQLRARPEILTDKKVNERSLEQIFYEYKQRVIWFIQGIGQHGLTPELFASLTTKRVCELYHVQLSYFQL